MTFKAFQKASNFLLLDIVFFRLLSSPGPFTIGLTVSNRTNVQCVVHHFRRKNKTNNSTIQGPKGGGEGSLEPWSPEMFVVEPGA